MGYEDLLSVFSYHNEGEVAVFDGSEVPDSAHCDVKLLY